MERKPNINEQGKKLPSLHEKVTLLPDISGKSDREKINTAINSRRNLSRIRHEIVESKHKTDNHGNLLPSALSGISVHDLSRLEDHSQVFQDRIITASEGVDPTSWKGRLYAGYMTMTGELLSAVREEKKNGEQDTTSFSKQMPDVQKTSQETFFSDTNVWQELGVLTYDEERLPQQEIRDNNNTLEDISLPETPLPLNENVNALAQLANILAEESSKREEIQRRRVGEADTVKMVVFPQKIQPSEINSLSQLLEVFAARVEIPDPHAPSISEDELSQ